MNKITLLTKSHFKKNRGTSIGLFLLMLIAATMVSIAMLLFTDVYPIGQNTADELDSGDGNICIESNLDDLSDDKIRNIFANDTTRTFISRRLLYSLASLPFGNGDITLDVFVDDHKAFNKEMAQTRLVEEDSSINRRYVYLPYQIHSSGGFNAGDTYTFTLGGKEYSLAIKGFTVSTFCDNSNYGCYELIVDDATYAEMQAKDAAQFSGIQIFYELKEGVKQSPFIIRMSNEIQKVNPQAKIASTLSTDAAISDATFMPLIIAVSFFAITLIILLVIVLMLGNSITNYVRENMKTLGALKAIGYTSKDIKRSLRLQFLLLSLIGSLIGTAIGFALMPLIASFCVSPVGIPYSVSFNPLPILVAVTSVVLFTLLISTLSLRKIKKIDPIVALRDGVETHNFKKNHARLDKSPFGLNVNLSLKTMLFNKKQNIITFFVTGLIMFLCTIALLMNENFNVHPNLKILSIEQCNGEISATADAKQDLQKYLENTDTVRNIRRFSQISTFYKDESTLIGNFFDDPSKMNNTDFVYTGNVPKYDNEVALAGKFAKEYGFKIGDEIELTFAGRSFSYVISGLVQSANNNGKQFLMSEEAGAHIIDWENAPCSLYFDCEKSDDTNRILEDCKKEFGDSIISTINFDESIEGSMTTFRSISSLMLFSVSFISAIVILLILFLLIKSLIYTKRKDYGIYKAIGYTSRNLIFQTALSFMPSIILSVLVFSVVSYHMANPYISLMMSSFGIVKGKFPIPISGMILICIAVILLSFCFAVFEARKIKKIEAYNMLVAE